MAVSRSYPDEEGIVVRPPKADKPLKERTNLPQADLRWI